MLLPAKLLCDRSGNFRIRLGKTGGEERIRRFLGINGGLAHRQQLLREWTDVGKI
jgi:hypothetical protein